MMMDIACGPKWHHIDEFDADEIQTVMWGHKVYVFEEEDREEDMKDLVESLRKEYIMIRGIVLPDMLRGRVEELSNGERINIELRLLTGGDVSGYIDEKLDDHISNF